MRVGILGSGLMGGKLGTLFARAGHEVVFSYARSRKKPESLARDAKGSARAGTPRQAVEGADAVLLAVNWSRLDDVLEQAGDLSGKVVVTCSLPLNADNTVTSGRSPRPQDCLRPCGCTTSDTVPRRSCSAPAFIPKSPVSALATPRSP